MEFKRNEINAHVATEAEIREVYHKAVELLKDKKQTVSTAESCTGGLMGKLFTDVSGASAVFAGGMITYTNHIKIDKLGVSAETVEKYTEVSYECAAEMAARAREYFETDIGISATGFAGPSGGTEKDPVGTVYASISSSVTTEVYRLIFGAPDRSAIREGTAAFLAQALIKTLSKA